MKAFQLRSSITTFPESSAAPPTPPQHGTGQDVRACSAGLDANRVRSAGGRGVRLAGFLGLLVFISSVGQKSADTGWSSSKPRSSLLSSWKGKKGREHCESKIKVAGFFPSGAVFSFVKVENEAWPKKPRRKCKFPFKTEPWNQVRDASTHFINGFQVT